MLEFVGFGWKAVVWILDNDRRRDDDCYNVAWRLTSTAHQLYRTVQQTAHLQTKIQHVWTQVGLFKVFGKEHILKAGRCGTAGCMFPPVTIMHSLVSIRC